MTDQTKKKKDTDLVKTWEIEGCRTKTPTQIQITARNLQKTFTTSPLIMWAHSAEGLDVKVPSYFVMCEDVFPPVFLMSLRFHKERCVMSICELTVIFACFELASCTSRFSNTSTLRKTSRTTKLGLKGRGMVHHSSAKGGLRRGGFSKGA